MKYSYQPLIIMLIILTISLTACGRRNSEEVEAAAKNTPTATPVPAGDAAEGEKLYSQTCIACHGPGGVGVTGLGKDMTASEFIASKTDAELVEFIKVGRDPSDPLNTTNVAMPPKGGNPALNDDNLIDIVAFMRAIQK